MSAMTFMGTPLNRSSTTSSKSRYVRHRRYFHVDVSTRFHHVYECSLCTGQMFKGPSQDIDAIYTAPTSAVCGVSLETNGKEYLITGMTFTRICRLWKIIFHAISPIFLLSPTAGKLEADGMMHVTLCDFIEPWESTSITQKKSLPQRYEMGCDCKVHQSYHNNLGRRAACFEFLDLCVYLFNCILFVYLVLRSLVAPPSPALSTAQQSACGWTG